MVSYDVVAVEFIVVYTPCSPSEHQHVSTEDDRRVAASLGGDVSCGVEQSPLHGSV